MLPDFKSLPYNENCDQDLNLSASRSKEEFAPCQCCGQQSKVIWGALGNSEKVHGAYLFHWTPGRPDHLPHIDLILGPWGVATNACARVLVTLRYVPRSGGGTFNIVDSRGRPADDRNLCGRAHSPDDGATPGLSRLVSSAVTALWLTEPAVNELCELDQLVDVMFQPC